MELILLSFCVPLDREFADNEFCASLGRNRGNDFKGPTCALVYTVTVLYYYDVTGKWNFWDLKGALTYYQIFGVSFIRGYTV